MLNRTPPNKPNTTNVLNSYRKRRQAFRGQFVIYGVAALLLIAGIVLVVRSTTGGNNPISALFPTDTLTPTLTFTPTNTSTPSSTPTETLTPTITLTPTQSGPVDYTIVEGDTLQAIAEKFNLGDDGVLIILEANPIIVENNGIYFVGQSLSIPPPGTVLNTPTPIPANLRQIEYTVLPGDTLAGIASKFNSKEDNANALQAGQVLKIPVNLVTSTPTLPPSSTPVTPTVEGQPTQTAPAANACTPAENTAFVSDLQTLINNTRTSNNLSALTLNNKLTAAAKAHTTDMICNNYLSHVSLSGSTPEARVATQGYTASIVLESLYALTQSTPQQALDWWMSDPINRANILNTNVTEFGIYYASSDKSLLGGYFVVVFAKP